MDATRTTVVIADDHAAVIAAITKLLEPEFDVIGTTPDGEGLVELARRLDPDLLLVDLEMPGMDGLEAVAECRSHGVRAGIVVVTVSAERALAEAALREGAQGYVVKDRLGADLRPAIEAALRGAQFVSPMNVG